MAAELSGRRFIAYSTEFAKRFRLALQNADPQLDKGLLAAEIGIQADFGSDVLGCYVALYLDTALVVNDKLGDDASAMVLEPERHFFLRPRRDGVDPRQLIDKADAMHLLSRQSRYFSQLGFTTSDYSKGSQGAGRTSLAVTEEANELFPGINYIRSRGCMPATMVVHGAGVEVGIKRSGAPNYARIVGPWTDKDFIRIPLPQRLLDAALPTLEAYDRYTRRFTDELAKRRRDARNSKKK
jgi:hypothetical protein